jgi:hypothetical protein
MEEGGGDETPSWQPGAADACYEAS